MEQQLAKSMRKKWTCISISKGKSNQFNVQCTNKKRNGKRLEESKAY
ncbi:hypothetical protein [Bacillus rhizoplanae]